MITNKLAVVLMSVLLVLVVSVDGSAVSLFSQNSSSLFSDYKAAAVGDLVTVLIIEQATATQSANTSSGNDNYLSVGPGGGVLADLIPLMSFGYGSDFDAAGSTTRGGSITAKLTTKVVEVYDNGTMKIEGSQKIVINNEEQELVINGIVRNRDIDQENTVLSSMVANAEISFAGTGIIGDKHEGGILTRFFNWLF